MAMIPYLFMSVNNHHDLHFQKYLICYRIVLTDTKLKGTDY